MTTTTPHPYAHILRAIADGQAVQWQDTAGQWKYQPTDVTLDEIARAGYHPTRYRIKPRTVRIGDIDVPEPLREMPADGTTVWWPDFCVAGDNMVGEADVDGLIRAVLPTLLNRGLLHPTREAAAAHAAALVALTARS